MIVSASRRTDIPAHYSDWFLNRIREGFVLVRNPLNPHQISRIKLTPDVVDGIVFWTKDPTLMVDRLDELKDYTYYFQFTITPYGKEVEPYIVSKPEVIMVFKRLSDKIGSERIIWRYDPILVNSKYTLEYHIREFERFADELHDYTKRVTISFIDEDYRGVHNNVKELALLIFSKEEQQKLSEELARIAHKFGLTIDTCAEQIDLQRLGIEHARCIDDRLFSKLLGCRLNIEKDKTQRPECGCVTSIDIGAYNTCRNGCLYCYANYNQGLVTHNAAMHNPLSPLLFGEIRPEDKITERSVKSSRDVQLRLGEIN
jgi:hypothetical protein